MVEDVGERLPRRPRPGCRRRCGPRLSMRMSSGASKRSEKPRSASSNCIEETPMSSTTPSSVRRPSRRAISSRSPKRPSTSRSRPRAARPGPRPPAIARGIAIDADHLARRAPAARGNSRRRRRCRRDRGRPRATASASSFAASSTGMCRAGPPAARWSLAATPTHSRAPRAIRAPISARNRRARALASSRCAAKRFGSQI